MGLERKGGRGGGYRKTGVRGQRSGVRKSPRWRRSIGRRLDIRSLCFAGSYLSAKRVGAELICLPEHEQASRIAEGVQPQRRRTHTRNGPPRAGEAMKGMDAGRGKRMEGFGPFSEWATIRPELDERSPDRLDEYIGLFAATDFPRGPDRRDAAPPRSENPDLRHPHPP
jgi:hypothetical protein